MRYFTIGAAWWTRPETPEQIACRLQSLISALRPIHPHFARWYQVISEDNVPELDGSETWLADAIAGKVCADELGAPAPLLGHLFVTMNAPADGNLEVALQKQTCDAALLDDLPSTGAPHELFDATGPRQRAFRRRKLVNGRDRRDL